MTSTPETPLPLPTAPNIPAQKTALRPQARALRAAQPATIATAGAAQLRQHVPLEQGRALAAVWPLPGEMDLRPLWHALHTEGVRILLPQTPPRAQPLIFRLWHPAVPMLPETFGTFYPDGPVLPPDLILVPLLAFDTQGHR